jgi:hypothetical protein
MQLLEFADFRKVDCQYVRDRAAELYEIYKMEGGNPCDGCGWNAEKNCPGYVALSAKIVIRNAPPPVVPSVSNGELARLLSSRYGKEFTKRQVAKLRARGELEALFKGS